MDSSFDFPSLPYVCQRRFVEICDPKTLKKFVEINALTKSLTKRCHIIKHGALDTFKSSCQYILSCYCKEKEYCHESKNCYLSSFKSKFNYLESAYISNSAIKNDVHFFQSLPVNLHTIKRLELTVKCIQPDDLMTLVHSELQALKFTGGIESDSSLHEFMGFIKTLSKLDEFDFCIIREHSIITMEFDVLIQQVRIGNNFVTRFNNFALLVRNQNAYNRFVAKKSFL